MDSILDTVKKMVGLGTEDDAFDTDILVHINSVMFGLKQIGVGPVNGFYVTDSDQTWTQYLGPGNNYEAAKSFIFLKVRLLFDPPTNTAVLAAMEKAASEYEWRLQYEMECPLLPPVTPPDMEMDF